MDSVWKAAAAYFVLWVLIRLSGRRALGQLTAFDLVLFFIISGATARAVMDRDYSLTNAFLVIVTFVVIDIGLSLIERRGGLAAQILKGVPTVLVDRGRLLRPRMYRARITEDEIMVAARKHHGVERIEDIKFAILEADGDISIVPRGGPVLPPQS